MVQWGGSEWPAAATLSLSLALPIFLTLPAKLPLAVAVVRALHRPVPSSPTSQAPSQGMRGETSEELEGSLLLGVKREGE